MVVTVTSLPREAVSWVSINKARTMSSESLGKPGRGAGDRAKLGEEGQRAGESHSLGGVGIFVGYVGEGGRNKATCLLARKARKPRLDRGGGSVRGTAGRGEKGTLGDRDSKWKRVSNRKERELDPSNPFCQSQ